MSVIAMTEVSRRFKVPGGSLLALDRISLSVSEGETVGIVGESGCGKSTLARLIAGIDHPSSGTVEVAGSPLRSRSRAERLRLARLVQMVFQDPVSSLNPRMRVGQIVGEPLQVHGALTRGQQQREVHRLLRRVGLPTDAAQRLPHEFSGGQRQRIGIARALALKPRILVADEPVSALDVSVQAQILNLLADLRDELGLTLVLVSHDLQVVEWVSDRVFVMYSGRLVEEGPSQSVFDHPGHPYTASLLAAVPSLHPASEPLGEPGEAPHALVDVPSALEPPSGCHFHPRCPLSTGLCREVAPAFQRHRPGHHAACHEVGAGSEPR